jgi:hypothetical protein
MKDFEFSDSVKSVSAHRDHYGIPAWQCQETGKSASVDCRDGKLVCISKHNDNQFPVTCGRHLCRVGIAYSLSSRNAAAFELDSACG